MELLKEKYLKEDILPGSMPSIEIHRENLKELLDDIEEKILRDLLAERQKIIGFTLSEASANLFAIALLQKKLVSSGFLVNHRFFTSEKIAENRFPFDFPNKTQILSYLVKQETYRERLCYGKKKDKKEVEAAISNFFKLKELIESITEGHP